MALVSGVVFVANVLLLALEVHGNGNGNGFTLSSPDHLTIDTTNLQARVKNTSITLTSEERTFTSDDGQSYKYKIAYLKFNGSITFELGSVVTVTGENGLSIKSIHGNITISTNITMTCAEDDPTMTQERCLGGYRVNYTLMSSMYKIYPGNGPGGAAGWKGYTPSGRHDCLAGAGHGGSGGAKEKPFVGAVYGLNDTGHLMGGSAGIFHNSSMNFVAGGGAIELEARNGTITVASRISASAAKGSGDLMISGSSGGLIRLDAAKVMVNSIGSLNVDGSDGIGGSSEWKKAGGGGGGVIHIFAREGNVSNLSLKAGNNDCDYSDMTPQAGYLYIRNDKGTVLYANHTNSRTNSFAWASPPKPTTPPVTHSFHIDPSLSLLNKTKMIMIYLEGNGNRLNVSIVLSLIEELQQMTQQGELTEEQLLSIVEIFKYFEKIVKLLSFKRPEDAKIIFSKLLNLSTSLMNDKNMKTWKKIDKLPTFLSSVEAMAVDVARGFNSSSLNHSTDKIVFQVRSYDSGLKVHGKYPDYSLLPDDYLATELNYVIIPEDALPDNSTDYKLIVMIFKDVQEGMPDYHAGYKVRSLVLSCTLLRNGTMFSVLQKPASIYFSTMKEKDKIMKSANCSYWNDEKSNWESDGVSVAHDSNETNVVCHTKHFTSFAVLMQHTDIPLTDKEKLSLLIITYVGCGISSGTLVITLIIFLSIESLSTERHRIHLNLVIALLLALVLFLAGITATENKIACSVIAATLHYLYTAAFTWMLIEGVHLYLKVVKVFGIENVKLRHYYIFGWGFPAIIVVISAAIKPYSYGTEKFCWLSMKDDFVWAFIGPIVLIIAVNCFILVVVVKTVITSASSVKSSDLSHIRAGLKGALVLMPLLGVSWITGLLAVNRETAFFQFAFAITNSLQGFFIFLLHVVFNTEVRTAFKRHREKHQLSKESDYNASFSSTHENDRKTSTKRKSEKSSSSNSSSFGRLKARLSMSMLPRTSRVISVQPMSSKSEDDKVQVNRTFTRGTSNKMAPSLQHQEEVSALHCPAELDEARPPYHRKLDSAKYKSNQI